MIKPNVTPQFLAAQGFSATIVERWWDKVFVLTYDRGCWLWVAATDHNGYGVIGRGGHDGQMMSAHRVGFILFREPLSNGEPLLHSCHNSLCVNPWHLRKGSQWENVHDMIESGRMPRGEDRGHAKITSLDAQEIRFLYGLGHTQKELGKRFGLCQQTVSQIVTREKWTHV